MVTMRIPRKVVEADQFAEGYHRAILTEAEEHTAKTGSESVRLTFRNGKLEHIEDLWFTTPKALARVSKFVGRLGIMPNGDDDEPDVDFDQALGREYVIKIKHVKNEQSDRIESRIDYLGIWPLNHKDEKVRAFLETPRGKIPAESDGEGGEGGGYDGGGSAGGGGSNGVQDFSDI